MLPQWDNGKLFYGQKLVQTDKKSCLLHRISQEQYDHMIIICGTQV